MYDAILSYKLQIDWIPINKSMIKRYRGVNSVYNIALESKMQQISSLQKEKNL